jgi:hypothetical protein
MNWSKGRVVYNKVGRLGTACSQIRGWVTILTAAIPTGSSEWKLG